MSNPTIHDTDGNGRSAALIDSTDTLSEVGRSRRDAMLPSLQEAVVREGRRRCLRRSAARGAVTVLLLTLMGVGLVNIWATSSKPRVTRNDPPGGAQDRQREPVRIVQIDSGVLGRHTVNTDSDPATYTIDDRELVAALAAIGRPAGLIRSQGRTWLSHAVTDAEPARTSKRLDGELAPPLTLRGKRPN
jgi:hypothetical protein